MLLNHQQYRECISIDERIVDVDNIFYLFVFYSLVILHLLINLNNQ
jgi:hypothetical protein